MFLDFRFVDDDAKPGFWIGSDNSSDFFDGESFLNDILTPGHIGVHRFANCIARLAEAELQRCGRAYRPLRIMRCESNAMSLGQRGNPPSFAQAATVSNIDLAYLAGPGIEEVFERC